MIKKIATRIIILVMILLCIMSYVYASDDKIQEDLNEDIELDSLVDILGEYTDNTNLDDMKTDLLEGKGLNYGLIGNYIISIFTKEIYSTIKGTGGILVIIILTSILKALELENESKISKVAYLVSFLIIISILLDTYVDILSIFSKSISTTTNIVQTVSPFIMALLMATGLIVSTGMLQPIFLFLIGSVGILINYIVIPLITLALAFSIVSGMSDTIKFNKLSMLLSKSSIWIVTVVFALVIGVLSLETNITSSIDGVTLKTTQAAISNAIPVVGKFVSDSTEIVIGSAQIIGKVSGTLGILTLIFSMLVPIIKILLIILVYSFLSAFIEALNVDKKISKLLEALCNIYKTLLGVLIGVMSLFVVSVGIIMSLMQKVTS